MKRDALRRCILAELHIDVIQNFHMITNEADRRYLEIGMLNTLLKFKGKHINSFKYFIPEIEEALAVKMADDTIAVLLKRRNEQWEQKRKDREGN